jgi:hypothetical protein
MLAVAFACKSSGRGGAYVIAVPCAALSVPGPVSVHTTGAVELETVAVMDTAGPPAVADDADAETARVAGGGGGLPPPPPQPFSAAAHPINPKRAKMRKSPGPDRFFIAGFLSWTVEVDR